MTEKERAYYGQDYKRTLFRQHLVQAVLQDELQKQGITADTLDGALEAAMLPNDLIRAGILYFPKQLDGHYDSVAEGYSAILSDDLKKVLDKRQGFDAFMEYGKKIGGSIQRGIDRALKDASKE
jgi:hypothetical protein